MQTLFHSIRILLCIFLAFAPLQKAYAIDALNNDQRYVDVSLIADTTQVTAGQTITIGIQKNIAPHWHTYWVNPGDSGEALSITWNGLDGLQFAPIQWPTPEKIAYDPLVNYGYSNDVTLLQELTFPDSIPTGPITLTANINLLVCEEICIPESSTHTLTLNSGEAGNPSKIIEASSNIPTHMNWNASYTNTGDDIQFTIDGFKQSFTNDQNSIELFPVEQGLVANSAPSSIAWDEEKLIYTQNVGELDIEQIPASDIVIAYNNQSGVRKSVHLNASSNPSGVAQTPVAAEFNTVENGADSFGFLSAILFALIGGMILNLMPCVFPVLSLKALKLVQIQGKEESKARAQGLAYTAGVIISFLILAGILIALQSAGAQIGWGFQLQNPIVIGVLIYLIFALGLNLSGMFEISAGRLANIGSKLTQKDDLSGSFFTGVLATAVATPCTAPFMGAAMAYALAQPAYVSLTVFSMLGLGLALPYLALCFIPTLRQALPKPGAWMDTFKQFLAFPMFATAAWLVWVLSQQTGSNGVFAILIGAVVLSLGIWTFTKGKRPLGEVILILALIPLFTMQINPYPQGVPQDVAKAQNWQSFSPERLDMALEKTDEPVFVNMTAAWCITCKVNERVALNTDATKMLFDEKNIQYFKGDWTNKDEKITQFLKRYGSAGVPLYVYYGPRDSISGQRPQAKILPQLLTPKIVREQIEG